MFGAALCLSACSQTGAPPATGVGGVPASTSPTATGEPVRIGMLLPLTGRNMRLGQQMANAAQLAVPAGHGAVLDVRDSDGAEGVAAAARAAIGNGDKILLGPLTAGQTGEVAGLSTAAGIPELAFTSDAERGRSGVWVMGLTVDQQVVRLVSAAHAQGRQHFAAFLPDSPLGHVMAQRLNEACAANGLSAPNIAFHGSDPQSIADGLKTLSAFDDRQKQISAATTAPAPAAPDAVNPVSPDTNPPASPGAPPATPPANATPAPFPAPPFDALLLGDTGLQLANVINGLKANRIDPSQVRILGPALWEAFASKLGALHGAWFAAPDSATRHGFVQQYRQHYGTAPTPLADIAYDTAAMAGALARQPDGLTETSLMRPDGFAGVDGVFALRSGGKVTRALAIFEIGQNGGATIVQPAPKTLTQTPS